MKVLVVDQTTILKSWVRWDQSQAMVDRTDLALRPVSSLGVATLLSLTRNISSFSITLSHDFSGSGLLTFWVQYCFVVKGWFVHRGMLSSISGSNPLVASSSSLPSGEIKNVYKYCQMSLWGKDTPEANSWASGTYWAPQLAQPLLQWVSKPL